LMKTAGDYMKDLVERFLLEVSGSLVHVLASDPLELA
ncbi:MAG: hypothetical protein RJA84_786, partial [Actinomycetota bacterium]|jgi:hypothetical protein